MFIPYIPAIYGDLRDGLFFPHIIFIDFINHYNIYIHINIYHKNYDGLTEYPIFH